MGLPDDLSGTGRISKATPSIDDVSEGSDGCRVEVSL